MESVIIFLLLALQSYSLLCRSSDISIKLSKIQFAAKHNISAYRISTSHTGESKLKQFINFRIDDSTVTPARRPNELKFVFDWYLSWQDHTINKVYLFYTPSEDFAQFKVEYALLYKSLKKWSKE